MTPKPYTPRRRRPDPGANPAGSAANRRSPPAVLIGIALVAIAVIGGLVFFASPRRGDPALSVDSPATQPVAAPSGAGDQLPVATVPPKAGAKGELPPLPDAAAARPPEVVRAVYEFAARHPEVLQYVPCFCGCERQGHVGNDDCFVASRDANGGAVTWDAHGMG